MAKRSTRKLNFTKASIAAIRPPTDQDRAYIYDRRTPALAICVTQGGLKTFYVYRRIRGRPARVRLGRFPEVTVEQARKQAALVLAEIARGHDPQEAKRALRRQCTLGELFEHYMAIHAEAHCSEKSKREDTRMFGRFLSTWAVRRLSTITVADITALHGRIGRKTPYQANRLLELLRKLFNHARRTLQLDKPNPCEGIRKFKEQSRDRFLDAAELRRFFKALAAESETFRDFFTILLLSGARRANVQAMRWEHLDLERELWRIPDTESKNREPLIVILSPATVEILRRRRAEVNGAEFVFSSRGITGHLVEPKGAWQRVLERANLKDCRIHDLRRTLGSWQANLGTSLPIIGASLGHKSLSATQVYARLTVDPVRASVNKATDAILVAGGVTKGGRAER